MRIEDKLKEMGLTLPQAVVPPANVKVPFTWVRIRGNRAYLSGHGPTNPDGSVALIGKIGREYSVDEGYQAARSAALAMLSSLKRTLGDLDRVTAWLVVRGMINATPDFTQTTTVINGFSDLILELYGPEAGLHARSAIGVTTVPLGMPLVIEAEVEITP